MMTTLLVMFDCGDFQSKAEKAYCNKRGHVMQKLEQCLHALYIIAID